MGKASEVIGTYTSDKHHLIADNIHPIDTKSVNVAIGSNLLVRGTIVTAAGTIVESKTDVPVGILCEDVQQSGEATTPSLMYISGSFNADAVVVGSSVTASDFTVALQNLGIFLK